MFGIPPLKPDRIEPLEPPGFEPLPAEPDEAVRSAVPLLRCATSVSVMEIDAPAGRMPIQAVATYLSRHGIVPNLIERRRQESIAATLLNHINEADPGYLVMGAYGDLPLAEAIFRGVTRTMLATSPIPLLMAH